MKSRRELEEILAGMPPELNDAEKVRHWLEERGLMKYYALTSCGIYVQEKGVEPVAFVTEKGVLLNVNSLDVMMNELVVTQKGIIVPERFTRAVLALCPATTQKGFKDWLEKTKLCDFHVRGGVIYRSGSSHPSAYITSCGISFTPSPQ